MESLDLWKEVRAKLTKNLFSSPKKHIMLIILFTIITGMWKHQSRDREEETNDVKLNVVDCNNTPLDAGDTVTITQGIKVKGASDIKKWTTVKNIRLVADDEELIEGRVDGTVMFIKTCYVKKITDKKKKK